jgi:hypothetical protein
MTTLQDIQAEKDAAVAVIQAMIDVATAGANQAKTANEQQQWGGVLDQLNRQRDAVLAQAYEDEEKLPEMQAALAELKGATQALNNAAQKMIEVTTFLNNLANVGNAANQAIAALKKKA